MYTFVKYISIFIAVTFVLTLHEFSHSAVAYKCGDPTPKERGRLSLNPLRHFDPLGLVFFVFAGFGWAKPVPINPYNFRNEKRGIILTSIAGVAMNYICAFLFYPILILVLNFVSAENYFQLLVRFIPFYIYSYSLGFCVFNLLPFYPLDGFNFLNGIMGGRGKVIAFLRKYGYYILMFLIIESYICDLLAQRFAIAASFDILGYILSFAQNILGFPISAFWDWIFGMIL